MHDVDNAAMWFSRPEDVNKLSTVVTSLLFVYGVISRSILSINFLFWKENQVLTGKTCHFLPQLTLALYWSRWARPINTSS